MTTIVIKDIHEGAGEVRELTGKEMQSINGGAGQATMVDTHWLEPIVEQIAKPIDVGAAIRNGHW